MDVIICKQVADLTVMLIYEALGYVYHSDLKKPAAL